MAQYYKDIAGQRVWYSDPLEYNGCQIWRPSEDLILAAGWTKYVEPAPTPAEKLAAAKQAKISEINTYNDSEAVNNFSINGVAMGWLTPTQRGNYRQTVEAAKRKGMTVIPFLGYNIPVDTVLSAIDDLDIYAWQQTACCESCIKAVEALTTIKKVQEYDYAAEFAKTPQCDFSITI